jgi:hypothetical protein
MEVKAEGIGNPQTDHQGWRPLSPLNPRDHGPADPGNLPEFLQLQTLTFPLFPQPIHNTGKYPLCFPMVHGKQNGSEACYSVMNPSAHY